MPLSPAEDEQKEKRVLEEHVNATLNLPIEDQEAEFRIDQGPVMTVLATAAAFTAGAAIVTGAYAAGKAVG